MPSRSLLTPRIQASTRIKHPHNLATSILSATSHTMGVSATELSIGVAGTAGVVGAVACVHSIECEYKSPKYSHACAAYIYVLIRGLAKGPSHHVPARRRVLGLCRTHLTSTAPTNAHVIPKSSTRKRRLQTPITTHLHTSTSTLTTHAHTGGGHCSRGHGRGGGGVEQRRQRRLTQRSAHARRG